MTYVYVASSWRNPIQPDIVAALAERGIAHYDFRNPPGGTGFAWSEIDPDWQAWRAKDYIAKLDHPRAVEGFAADWNAMQRATHVVLILPCGRSAHLELGWGVGAGKRTAILTRDGEEPELMAKMVDLITADRDALLDWITAALPWSCMHCGLLATGNPSFGTHAEGRTAGMQSCDEAVTNLPYGYRAHAAGHSPAHCLCATAVRDD